VAQLRRKKQLFDKAGARVVLVGMGTVAECADFARERDVPFPIISDPAKKLYQAFKLKRMPPWGILSPTLAAKGIAAMGRGHALGKPVGDMLQLPGVFVIDTDGRIVFSRPADDAAGRLDIETILGALERTS
jgi:peroxiredoxin